MLFILYWDIFIYGDALRISPEAPVPIIISKNKTENKGMAGNVFENLCALGVEVDIITNTNSIKKLYNIYIYFR